MRKIRRDQELWLALRARRLLKHRTIRRAAAKASRAFRASAGSRPFVVTIWTGEQAQKAICLRPPTYAPTKLCLVENTQESLGFLDLVRGRLAIPKDGVNGGSKTWLLRPKGRRKLNQIESYMDFSRIEYISTGASVVLAAAYDRARRLTKSVPPTVNLDDWSDAAFTTLYELGFFSIVGHVTETEERYRDSPTGQVRTMAMISGMNSTQLREASEKILLLSSFIGEEAPLEAKVQLALNSALGEAMSNVTEHAYPGTFVSDYSKVKRWWIAASADRLERVLRVVVYDQGASIPWTIPNRTWAARFNPRTVALALDAGETAAPHPYDADYIEFAMGEGRTQTAKRGRGEGLPQMRELVEICGKGSLTIVSRGGLCSYRPSERLEKRALPGILEGTLIEWEMYLPRATEDDS